MTPDRASNLTILAKLLGCSRRTIYRYAKGLRAAGLQNAEGYDVEGCRAHIWDTDGRRKRTSDAMEGERSHSDNEVAGTKAQQFGGQVLKRVPVDVAVDSAAALAEDIARRRETELEQQELTLELNRRALEESVLFRTTKRELEQHKLAVQRGEMVPRLAVEQALANRYMEVRTTLETLAPQIPSELEGLDHRGQVMVLLEIYRRAVWEAFARKDDVFPTGLPIDLEQTLRGGGEE